MLLSLRFTTAWHFVRGADAARPARRVVERPGNSPSVQFGYVEKYFASNYVAVPSRLFSDAAACGQCMTIKCLDTSCKALPAVTALIVDQCYECTGAWVWGVGGLIRWGSRHQGVRWGVPTGTAEPFPACRTAPPPSLRAPRPRGSHPWAHASARPTPAASTVKLSTPAYTFLTGASSGSVSVRPCRRR